MASTSIFITATEARQNPNRESAIHDEARAIESAILHSVRNGMYEATLSSGSPMTGNGAVNFAVAAIDTNTDQIYIPNHSFKTGDLVTVSTNGTLPAPLASTSFYSVIYIDANHIKLAASASDAVNNIPTSVNFTSGVTTITLLDAGYGYLSTPAVTLDSSPAGINATATANLSSYGSVDSIAVLSNGSGYTDVPAIQIDAQGSSATASYVEMTVVNVSVAFGGQDYRVGDILSVADGVGTACTATVTSVEAGGIVTTVNLGTPGFYSVLPSLSGAPTTVQPGGGMGCTLNLVLGVGRITVDNSGFGYIAPPAVLISGGGGIGATAEAVVTAGSVTSIRIINSGTGYVFAPTVTMSSGVGASAIAVLQPTSLGEVVVTFDGAGSYTGEPLVTVESVGYGAAIDQVTMRITNATITNSGGGYVVGDVLLVAGGAGLDNASIQVTRVGALGEILGYALITSGAYTLLPALDNNSVVGGSGSSATFNLTAGINTITLGTAGTGYLAPPVVTITPIDGHGTGAKAIALLNGDSVSTIKVTAAGSGFKQVPDINITSGSGAVARAIITNGNIESILVVNAGQNYTYPPRIIVEGGGLANAKLSPTGVARIDVIAAGNYYAGKPLIYTLPSVNQTTPVTAPSTNANIGYSINSITITNPGSGYSVAPNITIAPPNGNLGAQALAISSIGPGVGTQVISLYPEARDYWKVWKNENPSDPLLTRPYKERMDTVIAYFTNLGYTINRKTNPATGNTIQWQIMW